MSHIIIKFIKKLLRKSRTKSVPIHSKNIIPRNQHKISKTNISGNALKVLNRLNSGGFQAFLVGGSVRDLLLGKAPKDFDVATNATPNQIRGLFRNGRIIGRRFKLVHVIFNRDVVEVATFRSGDDEKQQETNERGMLLRDNTFGTLDQDAWRRDFTVNSLYYNIEDSSIVDYTGGFSDVQDRVLRIIGDAETRYREDPVRMLRAVRFSAKLHFQLAPETANPLKNLGHLLRHVSSSRLFDEMTKLYQCGESEAVQRLLEEHALFEHLFEQTANPKLRQTYPVNALLGNALESTDTRIRDNKTVTPAFLYAVLLWFPLKATALDIQQKESLPPLAALEKAMNQVISQQNQVIAIPKRFTQVMREIWLLQFRFEKRQGGRAFNLLQHPRFRAAYDFLALRALIGDEQLELAQWWTTFQDASEEEQQEMVKAFNTPTPSKKKPSRKRKPKQQPQEETGG